MKKAVLVILLSFVFIFGAFAAKSNFYFDAGLGFGKGKTTWGSNNLIEDYPSEIKELGIEFGGKVGIAPVRKFSLFIVLDLDWEGHRFFDDYGNYEQFSSVFLGPGLVFYPKNILQLAASVGISL